jgi:hypothetical protein
MTSMRLRKSVPAVSLIGSVLMFASCAYRLPAPSPPSQELIRIVANVPEQYAVQVDTGTVNEYYVPHDGRIKVGIPSYRPSCGVYLFDAIKLGGYSDPLNSWSISVNRQGKTVRKLSLRAIQKLKTDEVGYRIVKF